MTKEEIEVLAAQVTAMQIKLAAEQSHIHYEGPAVQVNPASGYAREMRKWESQHTQYGPPGRPYPPPGVSTEYPRAMFKAGHPPGRPGKIEILEHRDAGNDFERSNMEALGFRSTQDEAIALQAQWDLEMAAAEAIGNKQDKNMSPAAQAERQAVLDEAPGHVGEVPHAHPKTGRRDPA